MNPVREIDDAEVGRVAREVASQRANALAAMAGRPFPRIKDTFGGLDVEAEAAPGERRFVTVVLDMGPRTCTTYDTAEAGTRDADGAIVRREGFGAWRDVEDYLATEGLAIAVEVDGRPGGIEVLEGSTLGVYDDSGGLRGRLSFDPGKVVYAGTHGVTQVLDWFEIEPALTADGVRVRAVAVEMTPRPSP